MLARRVNLRPMPTTMRTERTAVRLRNVSDRLPVVPCSHAVARSLTQPQPEMHQPFRDARNVRDASSKP